MKIRLDKHLTDTGLCRSRSQAQELIQQALIEIREGNQWTPATKASQKVFTDDQIRILDNPLQHYVSRAALKLRGAIDQCDLDLKGLNAIDIGQSTGGFTQVLLEAGAQRVTGIEVGHSQLAPDIRDDSRVEVFEGVNAKHLSTWFEEHKPIPGYDLAVMDVSFISQTLIIPEIARVLLKDRRLLSLVKPQFEVGPEGLGKGGLVNDPALYSTVESSIRKCCESHGFTVRAYFESSIQGGDGNREFFVYATLTGSTLS